MNNYLEVDDIVREQLKPLSSEMFYFYADEGGMLGTPHFLVSTTPVRRQYFEYLGKFTKRAIHIYIVGRLLTWQISAKEDYSESFKLVIL
jgi:hypothetical protein